MSDTTKIISITTLQNKLTQKMMDASNTKEPIYTLRNNECGSNHHIISRDMRPESVEDHGISPLYDQKGQGNSPVRGPR